MSKLNKQESIQLVVDYLIAKRDIDNGHDQYKGKAEELLNSIRVNWLIDELSYCDLALNESLEPTFQNVQPLYEIAIQP